MHHTVSLLFSRLLHPQVMEVAVWQSGKLVFVTKSYFQSFYNASESQLSMRLNQHNLYLSIHIYAYQYVSMINQHVNNVDPQ